MTGNPAIDLISWAKAGDRSAFDGLVGPFVNDAFRLAFGMLHDREAAEDAVQEATLRSWRKLHNLRPGTEMRPWFLAIVANQCRTTVRGRWWSVLRLDRPSDAPDSGFEDSFVRGADLRAALRKLAVDERSLRRFGTPSFKWAPGLVAAVLAVALVAGLLYSRGYLGPHGSAVNPPKRSIPAQYGAVTMISPTTGWADWTAGHPRRTTDGGAHWTDVSPPLVLVGGFTGDYFLDATHAWVLDVLWGQQLQFVSLGTTDGGRSWQQGAEVTFDANHNYVVDASGYHGDFRPYFLDAEHGWLMIASNVTGSSSSQSVIDTLYKTIDGGLHWTLVSTNAWTYAPGTIGAQTIGCPWGMPRFISPSTGFMITVDRIGVGRCPAPLGRLALHVTHDGGVTWQIEPLAIDGSSPSCAKSCVLDPPEFVDQLHGFLVLQDPAGSRLLATSDGGISWSFRSSMPAYLTAWFETGDRKGVV